MAGMIKPQGIDTMRGQGAGHWLTDSAKNPNLAKLEQAGLQEYKSPTASQTATRTVARPVPKPAAAPGIGMMKGGLYGAAMLAAPGAGGALGYGAGALKMGNPVIPAMKEGWNAHNVVPGLNF